MAAPVSLTVALVSLGALLTVLSAVTAVERARSSRRDRRRHEAQTASKRRLLAVIADENHVLEPTQARSLELVAAPLLGKLRGDDRDALVSLLDRSGVLERARRQLSQRGAVRRARAAELLGAAADAKALPGLVRLLDDRDRDVRIVAARALGRLGAPAVEPLLGALDARRPIPGAIVTMALVHVGPEAAPELTDALAPSSSSRARRVAAELLGRLGAFSAAEPLLETLAHDPDNAVRASTARALGRLGLPGACRELLEQVERADDLELRLACIGALGEIGGSEAIPLLSRLLRSTDHRVARTAAAGLAACGTTGRRALEAALADRASAAAAREQLAQLELREAARAPRRRSDRAA